MNRQRPQLPKRLSGLVGVDALASNRSPQSTADLGVEQLWCPKRPLLAQQTLFRRFFVLTADEQFADHRCIDNSHQSPRPSRIRSTISWVLRPRGPRALALALISSQLSFSLA